MILIADSSVIIAFQAVDRLDVLRSLFGEILIPDAVYKEVFAVEKKKAPAFIKVVKLKNREVFNTLFLQLGAGESEVIALALEKKTDKVAIDDKLARRTAEKLGLKVIGTVGIVLLAKEKKLVPKVKGVLDAMMKKISFRLSDAVVEKTLKAAGEK